MKILATLGYFDASGEGVVLEVALARGTQRTIVRQVIPEQLRVAGKGFTGATWTDEPGRSDLIVCGFNALYRYSMPELRHTGILHQPCMNDLFELTSCTGWCRGLLVTADHLIVGLTEIRRMPRYRWCDRPFEGTKTAVLCIDKKSGRLVTCLDIGERARHPKLFGLLEMP